MNTTQNSVWGGRSRACSGDPLEAGLWWEIKTTGGTTACRAPGSPVGRVWGALAGWGFPLTEGLWQEEVVVVWWGGILGAPLQSGQSLGSGCFCLKGGGHRGSGRGWVVCSTVGLIPDALLGVQGAGFVCLGVLDLLSHLPPCPSPTQPPQVVSSWYSSQSRGDVQLGCLAMPTPSQGQKCKSSSLHEADRSGVCNFSL